jgi:endonuclease/exonuclease/phosphatase family metal-dependent hydrolase
MSRGIGPFRNGKLVAWALLAQIFIFGSAAVLGISLHADTFRVATYNVENYLDQPTATRPHAKPLEAKAKIRETIRAASPDVLALEEIGSTNALLELRASLQGEGQSFPFWELIQCFDTNIHIAVLSKLPIIARRPHTNDCFLLDGHRFQVKRGFAELDIQAATNFSFTLIAAHLKSPLPAPEADEAEERLGEAKALRRIIDARLEKMPYAKFIVLGDFNDTMDSASTKEIVGRGQRKLFDTRPSDHNGAWTYFYGKSDTYSRIDFILLSPALKKSWLSDDTRIPEAPNWRIGSDHRLIVAGFTTEIK